MPFSTWLLIGYFKSIPYELEECALIDGATRLQILRRITGLLRVAILYSFFVDYDVSSLTGAAKE